MRSKTICCYKTALVVDRTFTYDKRLATSDIVANLFRSIADPCKETVIVFTLNTDLKLTGIKVNSLGSNRETTFDGADIIRFACLMNATGVILAHNHPSNNLTPSACDRKFTRAFKKLLPIVNMRLMDHLIIGFNPKSYVSMMGKENSANQEALQRKAGAGHNNISSTP